LRYSPPSLLGYVIAKTAYDPLALSWTLSFQLTIAGGEGRSILELLSQSSFPPLTKNKISICNIDSQQHAVVASPEQAHHPVLALSKMILNDEPQTDPNDQPIQPKEQMVNPFTVEAADERCVDYNKVVEQSGTRLIDQATLDRFEELTGQKAHRYLRCGLFFSQRQTLAILYV